MFSIRVAVTKASAMSERSIYLRDQADQCRQHADTLRDARTREELHRLADVYIARAAQIESTESPLPASS